MRPVVRADAVRPSSRVYDPDYPVTMIGHDYKLILVDSNFSPDIGGPQPFLTDDLSQRGQVHFAIHDLAEDVTALIGAKCNKIRSGLGIIITFHSYGPAVVFLWVRFQP
jgi:hypothetical protein